MANHSRISAKKTPNGVMKSWKGLKFLNNKYIVQREMILKNTGQVERRGWERLEMLREFIDL